MARLTIDIPDEVLAKLQMAGDYYRKPIDLVATRKLSEALTLLPQEGGRVVMLSGDALQGAEAILGGGSILNGGDLLQKVQRLAGISFLHIRLPFTPNQLEALVEKATRQGLTVEQLAERTAPRMYANFFDLVERS
jgi:hypothetical protein